MMKRFVFLSLMAALVIGCSEISGPVDPALSKGASIGASKQVAASASRPFKMNRGNFEVAWGVERDQELACGGSEVAGGATTGSGNFTHLGLATIDMSAAWDIGNLLTSAEFEPIGPAGGPVAPVFGRGDYPYDFHYNPLTGTCAPGFSATGELLLTAANGDHVHGFVAGGETHRLDFVLPGDGIETFAIIEVDGGTGRFEDATGSFVVHTITRFDFDAFEFVIDLAEVLPGGTIGY